MKVLMVMHCIQAHAASISKVCEVLHKALSGSPSKLRDLLSSARVCELPQQIEVTLKDWVPLVDAATSPMLYVGIPLCILDHSHSATASPRGIRIARWARILGS